MGGDAGAAPDVTQAGSTRDPVVDVAPTTGLDPSPTADPPTGPAEPVDAATRGDAQRAAWATALSAPASDTVGVEPPRRPRDRPRPSRRTLLVAGAVVVVLAAGGTVAGLATSGSGSSPASTSSSAVGATVLDDLATWLRANASSATAVLATDADVAGGLSLRGVDTHAVTDLSRAAAGAVVVTASGAGDPAPSSVAATRTLAPLARFGTYDVDQLVDRAVDDVVTDRADDRGTARAAATGLLGNAAVTLDPGARAAFTAGALDLRAAAFVALLAGSQPVRVVSAPQDAAEAAVDLPVRSLVVTVADPAGLRALVDTARYPYAPTVTDPSSSTSSSTAGSSVLLVWPVVADPALTLD